MSGDTMNDVKRTFCQVWFALFMVLLVGFFLMVPSAYDVQGAGSSGDDSDSDDELDMAWGSTLCCGLWLLSIILGVAAAVWVYKDAEARNDEGWAYALMIVAASVFFPLIGVLIGIGAWLFVRPDWDAISRPGMTRPAPRPRYPGYQNAPGPYPPAVPYQAVRPPPPPPPVYPPHGSVPPSPPAPSCPRCGSPTEYSGEYDDYYCWECESYFNDMV